MLTFDNGRHYTIRHGGKSVMIGCELTVDILTQVEQFLISISITLLMDSFRNCFEIMEVISRLPE